MTSSNRLSVPFSAEEVRAARFSNRAGGYDVDEVLLFLNKVANDIQAFDGERAALRADMYTAQTELQRLRDQKPEPSAERVEISVHAVGLLSQAQQTADSCVAEAEQYAREVIESARNQYRDILDRARQAAAQSVRDIEVASPEAGVPVPEIDYVRTYTGVAQAQLRSVLDALTHEVDKLGEISPLDTHQPEPTSEELSWQPTNLVSFTAAPAGANLNSGVDGM